MRRLTKSARLQADSVTDIVDPWGDEARRLARREGVEFGDRKLSGGPLLNALAVWFLEQPIEVGNALAIQAVSRLEALLAETDEERAAASARLKFPPQPIELEVEELPPGTPIPSGVVELPVQDAKPKPKCKGKTG